MKKDKQLMHLMGTGGRSTAQTVEASLRRRTSLSEDRIREAAAVARGQQWGDRLALDSDGCPVPTDLSWLDDPEIIQMINEAEQSE